MHPKSVKDCCLKLAEKNLTIAFAESATTGRLIYEFTSVPGCGSVNTGSIVCYDRSVKEGLLNVSSDIIDRHTAESAEVTRQLSLSLKKLIKADIYISVTGLASEGGSETPEKPVGTMFVHGIIKGEEWETRMVLNGSPDQIIEQCIDKIAADLLERVNKLT